MEKGKGLERKFYDIEKLLGGLIVFVDTFAEDDNEVLPFKLNEFNRLNIKYESVKEEIFTSLSDGEFKNFEGKITTCNEHIEKLEVRLKSLNLKYSKNSNVKLVQMRCLMLSNCALDYQNCCLHSLMGILKHGLFLKSNSKK
ncbi:hypothetical protein TNCT_470041 [Trichonephila clavata]|uniref:Uncharacterized protein n=1 Tax=Trichonephila clavata TaxID=2740835 RepID=A0A8X6HMS7_TRICU|nr:hypothetical protein TNCT_470041 [Trichonephila clavata]